MVDIDPLQGIYVRGLRVTNNTPNVLRLSRADAVMVDAAGNDNGDWSSCFTDGGAGEAPEGGEKGSRQAVPV